MKHFIYRVQTAKQGNQTSENYQMSFFWEQMLPFSNAWEFSLLNAPDSNLQDLLNNSDFWKSSAFSNWFFKWYISPQKLLSA